MHALIAGQAPEIAEICRLHQVCRLEVFGSAARGQDFDVERSDFDFLVEFEPDPTRNAFDRYFALKRALEGLLHRNVDLLTPAALANPYLRASIDSCREVLHGA